MKDIVIFNNIEVAGGGALEPKRGFIITYNLYK